MQRVKQEDQSIPTPNTPSPLASPLPSGAYTDYVLYSTAPSTSTGWRYNIMKFGALGDRVVDPAREQFLKPVKLNRKDPRTVRRLTDEDRERINKRILERNGMDVDGVKGEGDVKDEDGKFVKKEKEQIDLSLVGTGKSGQAPKLRSKNSMFKKKTKRVFVSSEEARRLKREEWMPWVLEDDEGNERWIGRLEGGVGERPQGSQGAMTAAQEKQAKADANGTGMKGWRPPPPPSEAGGGGSSYVAFVNDADKEGFQVVPVHRWYKFSQGPKYVTLGTDEAETEYERQQKNQDAERWVMHKRNAPSASSAPKDPAAPPTSSSAKPSSSTKISASAKAKAAAAAAADSTNSGIRSRLLDKSVASGRRLSGAPASSRKFKSVISGSSSLQDDDELGARVKREDSAGGEQGDDEFDYDEEFQDDEEGIAKIDDLADEQETKELEERIKKEMRAANRYEGVPEDDDDDEEDWEELTNTGKEVKKLVRKADRSGAYDSDEESSDDNASVASNEPSKDSKDASRSSSARPSSTHQRTNSTSSNRGGARDSSRHPSRAGSPSGSALVAKRATSPTGSASGKKSRNSSPGPSSGGGKRKRLDGGDESDGGKRRKNGGSPAPGEGTLISEADLVALFKTKEGHSITTQEVLSHFKRALKSEPKNKAAIGGLLQTVANLVGGKLVLKPGY